jgi:ABC-type Fe3+ transport system permease subunit
VLAHANETVYTIRPDAFAYVCWLLLFCESLVHRLFHSKSNSNSSSSHKQKGTTATQQPQQKGKQILCAVYSICIVLSFVLVLSHEYSTTIAPSGFGEILKVQPLEQFRLTSHTSSREEKPETAMKLLLEFSYETPAR